MHHPHGPVQTLPGHKHKPSLSSMCSKHPLVSAHVSIQGETDSFGAEYTEMCQACYEEYLMLKESKKEDLSFCDWCNSEKKNCKPKRDPDEGSSGRVYMVCTACAMDRSLWG